LSTVSNPAVTDSPRAELRAAAKSLFFAGAPFFSPVSPVSGRHSTRNRFTSYIRAAFSYSFAGLKQIRHQTVFFLVTRKKPPFKILRKGADADEEEVYHQRSR
jgi:hypothetical protein